MSSFCHLFAHLVISQTNSLKLMSPSPSCREQKLSIATRPGRSSGCRSSRWSSSINRKSTWSITFTISFSSSSVGDHPNVLITWDKKKEKGEIFPHLSQFFCPNRATTISKWKSCFYLFLFSLFEEKPVEEREDFAIFFQDLCWKLLCNLDKTQNVEQMTSVCWQKREIWNS